MCGREVTAGGAGCEVTVEVEVVEEPGDGLEYDVLFWPSRYLR